MVSIFDRGFLYGDGLFETLRLYRGRPFRWEQHMERLQRGAALLRVKLPKSARAMREVAEQLVVLNKSPEGVLRITVSRGTGDRGYSIKGCQEPTLAAVLYPAPAPASKAGLGWSLVTIQGQRLGVGAMDPLSAIKTCNRLHNVLGRVEADDAGADEALFCNARQQITEGTSSNVFWINSAGVCTPPLHQGALAGVTRQVVAELTGALGWNFQEKPVTPDGLCKSAGVFLSLSTLGIVEAHSLNGHRLRRSERVTQLKEAYSDLVRAETG